MFTQPFCFDLNTFDSIKILRISGLYPLTGVVGQTIKVYGDGFDKNSQIYLGQTAVETTYISSTMLSFAVYVPSLSHIGLVESSIFDESVFTTIPIIGLADSSIFDNNAFDIKSIVGFVDSSVFDPSVFDSGVISAPSNTSKVSVLVSNLDGMSDSFEGFVFHVPNAPSTPSLQYLNSQGVIDSFVDVFNPNKGVLQPSLGQDNSISADVLSTSSTVNTDKGMMFNQTKYKLTTPQTTQTTTSKNGNSVLDTKNIQSQLVDFVDLAPKKIRSEVV